MSSDDDTLPLAQAMTALDGGSPEEAVALATVAADTARTEHGAASAAYRQRLTPTLRLQLTYEIARYDARTLTFDRTGRESTAMLAWQSPTAWQFDFAVAHRRGDVLAYSSPPRPDLVASGKNLVFVDTFGRRSPLIAYYFPAVTRSAELGASRFLGRNLTLSVNASWSRTTHGPGAFYLNRVGSLSLQRTF